MASNQRMLPDRQNNNMVRLLPYHQYSYQAVRNCCLDFIDKLEKNKVPKIVLFFSNGTCKIMYEETEHQDMNPVVLSLSGLLHTLKTYGTKQKKEGEPAREFGGVVEELETLLYKICSIPKGTIYGELAKMQARMILIKLPTQEPTEKPTEKPEESKVEARVEPKKKQWSAERLHCQKVDNVFFRPYTDYPYETVKRCCFAFIEELERLRAGLEITKEVVTEVTYLKNYTTSELKLRVRKEGEYPGVSSVILSLNNLLHALETYRDEWTDWKAKGEWGKNVKFKEVVSKFEVFIRDKKCVSGKEAIEEAKKILKHLPEITNFRISECVFRLDRRLSYPTVKKCCFEYMDILEHVPEGMIAKVGFKGDKVVPQDLIPQPQDNMDSLSRNFKILWDALKEHISVRGGDEDFPQVFHQVVRELQLFNRNAVNRKRDAARDRGRMRKILNKLPGPDMLNT